MSTFDDKLRATKAQVENEHANECEKYRKFVSGRLYSEDLFLRHIVNNNQENSWILYHYVYPGYTFPTDSAHDIELDENYTGKFHLLNSDKCAIAAQVYNEAYPDLRFECTRSLTGDYPSSKTYLKFGQRKRVVEPKPRPGFFSRIFGRS